MDDQEQAKSTSEPLLAAIAAAFPVYLRGRLDQLGVVGGSTVEAAIADATARLQRELSGLLAQPMADQTSSPLELVRAATAPVTEVLVAMGLRPPARDEWSADQYPDDVYNLYPASSQDLGDDAWRLHLAWGKAKAMSMAGAVPAPSPTPAVPVVALFGVPAEERDEIAAAVSSCGYRPVVWRNPAALQQVALRPALVLVDLRHPNAHDAIRELVAAGVRVVAAGPQVNDLNTPGIMAMGAEEVVDSARLAMQVDRLLPRLA